MSNRLTRTRPKKTLNRFRSSDPAVMAVRAYVMERVRDLQGTSL